MEDLKMRAKFFSKLLISWAGIPMEYSLHHHPCIIKLCRSRDTEKVKHVSVRLQFASEWLYYTSQAASFHVCTDLCKDEVRAMVLFRYQFICGCEQSIYCCPIDLKISRCSPQSASVPQTCFLTQQPFVEAFERTSPRTFVWESAAVVGRVWPDWHIPTLFAQGLATDDWLPLITPGESEP